MPIFDFPAFHHSGRGTKDRAVSNLRLMRSMLLLEVVGTLAVLRFLIVAAAARKIRSRRMLGSWQRAIANAVAVHVSVTGESAQPVQIFFAQNLAAVDRASVGYSNGSDIQLFMPRSRSDITNTRVWNCSARLKASCAMLKHSATEHGMSMNVLGIAVREKCGRKNVALRSARRQTGGRPTR